MSTILLSFSADVFERLERGEKKFEYRKHFPSGNTKVYFYVSSPVKAITGIGEFGDREELITWLEKYGNRSCSVKNRINDHLTDCNYAVPLLRFQKTNRISLAELQKNLSRFIVPRMYYYIDDSELLNYLNSHLHCEGTVIEHSFHHIQDNDIC